MIYGSSQRAVVPGRLQSLAEMTYEFVASTVTGVMGKDGMKFFPFVFSLFMFVLASNLLGLMPGSFTVTSQIIVTAAFAFSSWPSCWSTASSSMAPISSACSCRQAFRAGSCPSWC
jgi:F0F1-type ATP synthase membrane subunit a